MMAARIIIQRGDSFDDSGEKNSWRWEWTEFVVKAVEERLGLHIRKLLTPGTAFCTLCKCDLKYGPRGRVCLDDHVKTSKHRKAIDSLKANTTLPGLSKKKDPVYGANPMFAEKLAEDSLPWNTPLCDRISNSEALVIAFLAENSMPLAAAPKVLDLVTALSNDKAACDRMRLDDATASYKLKYGVAATFQDELLSELRETPFALNLDEAMNSNHKKVVTILVSHFSPTLKKTVVHHLVSFVVKRLTSEILYGKVVDIFEQFHLPWTNLMALLTDSCAVMRGKKSGLETLIRERKAPHLLDIDGDSCHHAHNAAKEFYLQGDDKRVYQQFVEDIFSQHDLQLETKMTINKLQDTIRKTFMTATKDGKERKSRLIEKLFYFQEKTLLHLHFYCSVLPILQEYIKFFQKKEPVIHELHNKQEALLKDFFMCFIKCEQLQGGPKILLRLDLSNENHHLPTSGCFYGQYVKTELAKRGKKDNLKAEFLQQAHQAYIHGGTTLQKKMPLNNPVLRSFSCLDPLLRTSSTALLQILKLPTFFKHLLSDQEIDQFDFEARKFNTDNSLPAVTEKDSIDSWWAQISTDKYPVLTRLARASISCFHGPLVESSFSTMSEIIDKSNTSIDEHTYSAIQTVKYALKAEGKTAVHFFFKETADERGITWKTCKKHDKCMAKKPRKAFGKQRTKRKSESLGVAPQKQTTKRKATNDLLEEAKRARLEHQSSTKSTRSSQSSGNCGKTCSKPTPKSKHGVPHSDSERVTHDSSPVSKEGNAESKDTIGKQNKSATGNTKVGPPGHQTSGSSTPASRSKQTSLASFFQPAKVKQSEGKSAQNERDKDIGKQQQHVQISSSRPAYPLYRALDPVLAADGREIKYIQGDGNCFFRVISIEMDGTEDNHEKWRQLICDKLESSPDVFQQYVERPLATHVRDMRQPKMWATTCEMYGAAHLLSRDIYVFSPPPDCEEDGTTYRWLKISPEPETSDIQSTSGNPNYLTMCHTHGNHFDRVVPLSGKSNSELPLPQLDESEIQVDLSDA